MVHYSYDEGGRLTREDNKALDRTVRYAYDGARLVRTYCEMGTRLAEVLDFGYDAQSNSFVDTDYERRVCFGCVRKVRALAPLAACCPSELALRLLDGLSTILWKHKVGEEWEEHEYIVRRNILGDVTQLYDTLGNLCVQYRYDAWGQVYPITIFDYHGIARVNPILYRGYVYDKETELYYLNSRYYDPETGRFLNADSLEYLEPESVYGINLYAYCGGDPVNNVDPTGHLFFEIGLTFLLTALFGGMIYVETTYHPIGTAIDWVVDGIRNVDWAAAWDTLNEFGYSVATWWNDLWVEQEVSKNVIVSTNYDIYFKNKPVPLPPGTKGQGKEKGNRSRANDNWTNRNNFRRPPKKNKHTPGRDHRKYLLWLLRVYLGRRIRDRTYE